MATIIPIRHVESGLVRDGLYGYSWTYLFFGWFVPLFRGELMVAALHALFTFLTVGVWQVIASFIYNRQYMTRMLTQGWVLAGTEEQNAKARAALGIAT
ncbi:MAG: hypothetical protein H6865_04000 [Rhodospirillales bacterium]|nr:hypothetical protein [Alphaproteobacteria bacterium]MCB9986780.1 hypothetical protein [Rhodospirillales bacterium]USO08451.1 MAG: hypothetical protein H6866_04375 [Rhodospirillales bacterium]